MSNRVVKLICLFGGGFIVGSVSGVLINLVMELL